MIAWVNQAWQAFAAANGGDPARTGIGVSYLQACAAAGDDPVAHEVAGAIRAALAGDLPGPLTVEVPCHSPATERWFDVLISSRFDDQGRCLGATVTLSLARSQPRSAAGRGLTLAQGRPGSAAVMTPGVLWNMIEAFNDGVALADREGTLVLASPAARASAIALTLRAVGGLTTAEIAKAFLVPEATMAQRISRAKQSIKDSGIPFQLPTPQERAQRLRAVLHVLYLIFNEGYTSSAGPHLQRADLSHEAIRLARIVHNLQPDDTELAGLLALMLLTDARRLARTNAEGELIPLGQQSRALWDRQQIAEGLALLSTALPKGSIGPYQLQAAIAAVHDEAARAEDTDWPQILALYELLKRISDNPMVILNHAIAAAMVHGAKKGLDLLHALKTDARISEHHRLDAVRAHLLEMAGNPETAARDYRTAAAKTTNLPERNYLLARAARLAEECNRRTGRT